ncbi:Fic family protein [Legionella israelensis]|nr:Fic family protein [Legionella israelensis]
MPVNLEKFFARFINEQYWKLIIDQKKWPSNNPLIFDQEDSPGYLESTSLALWGMLATVDDPVTTDYIQGLHDLAYHDRKGGIHFTYTSKGISGLSPESFNEKGFEELIHKIRQGVKLSIIYKKDKDDKNEKSKIFNLDPSKTPQELYQELLGKVAAGEIGWAGLKRSTSVSDAIEVSQNYIDRYKEEIKNAVNTDEKLTAIVRFIQDMHQYHPFADGNGRTFIFLLLNKLLLQNNLSPAAVPVPGRFTGWSTESLVEEVKKGQKAFQDLCTDKSKTLSFMDYLSQTLKIKDEKREKVLAKMNIQSLLQQPHPKSVFSYFDFGDEVVQLARIRDKNTVDMIFEKNPDLLVSPHATDLLATSAYFCNNYMVKKVLDKSTENSSLNHYKSAFVMSYVISGFTFPDFKEIIEHKNLKMSSADIFSLLQEHENVLTTDKDLDENKPLFWQLLVLNYNDALEYLLKKLKTSQLENLISIEVDGINGAQLLSLFHPDLLEYCFSKINETDLQNLLQKPITTSSKKEVEKLKTIDPVKTGKEVLEKYKNKQQTLQGLTQYSLHSANQHVTSKEELNEDALPKREYK